MVLWACTVDNHLAKARGLSLRTVAQTMLYLTCTTIHKYPIFSTRYSVMCKVYTGYCGTSEIEHGLCACTEAKARGLSLRTGAQTMLYLTCTTIHRYPSLSQRYSVFCKAYTGLCGTSEIEHGSCACTVDNPFTKARGLSLRTGAQTMLYL